MITGRLVLQTVQGASGLAYITYVIHFDPQVSSQQRVGGLGDEFQVIIQATSNRSMESFDVDDVPRASRDPLQQGRLVSPD